MSKATDDFWNEVAIGQMAAGGSPSVVTKEMRKALDGDKEAAKKIKSEINVQKAVKNGVDFKKKNSSYSSGSSSIENLEDTFGME